MSSAANGEASFLGIPLEIRHHIFKFAAARDVKPRDVLRYWFEKKDIQETIAKQLEDAPDADVVYVAGYNHQYDEDTESQSEGEEAEEESDGEDSEDEDHDDEDNEDGHAIDEDDASDLTMDFSEDDGLLLDMDDSEDDMVNVNEDVSATSGVIQSQNTQAPVVGGPVAHEEDSELEMDTSANSTKADQNKGSVAPQCGESAVDAEMLEGEDHDSEQEQDEISDAGAVQEDEDMDGEDGTTAAAHAQAVPAPQSRHVIYPAAKWHHVPKFMRLTQCPPPTDLFLISKQLNAEAKHWFYQVTTLKIDATASFLHTSFFEFAMEKLADAAFSPMENIKKAEVTFVWDSTWIRAESTGFAQATFPMLLNVRAGFVLRILQQAPELERVVIHWHDSADDKEAKSLMAETLEPFIINLNAVIETKEHYIAPDAKPCAKSRAGKQRLEFKAIFDNGCETF